MDDRRRHPRHTTQLQLEIYEAHSGQRLGRLADLSLDGFMLFSETPQEQDKVIECVLRPAEPIAGLEQISFAADCLWSRPGADGQHSWAGYCIIDMADEHADKLQQLLEQL